MPMERGRIYVAPPNRHLLLTAGGIRVNFGPRENRSRPAIDPHFRTAATNPDAVSGRVVRVSHSLFREANRCAALAVLAVPAVPIEKYQVVGHRSIVSFDDAIHAFHRGAEPALALGIQFPDLHDDGGRVGLFDRQAPPRGVTHDRSHAHLLSF